MSTQPTPQVDNAQSPQCVTTDYLGCLACLCGKEFVASRADQKQCSKRCANVAAHRRRDKQRAECKKLVNIARNASFAYLNRDRSIGFDGRYEGPMNQCFTVDVSIRKDTGYKSSPHDVHVRPTEPKFNIVTVEDVDWTQRQKAFPHSLGMHRPHNSFCVLCADMVIDASKKQVRVTRGVYLPIEHRCPTVRVYDLAGKLLEVKPL